MQLTTKPSRLSQYFISTLMVFSVAGVCYLFSAWIGYKVVALLLLMTVSLAAMLFDILPVLTAAVLSALIWNFFFIPPVFTFHVDNAEDLLMFLMYFFIALLNGVLTLKIREAEKKARDKEEKENSIKLYNTLINSLSHELRTPIATIVGSVDTLKENADNLTDNNKETLLTEIEKATMRLNRQVGNLLNMSRLESGIIHLNKDWCDINDLINSVLQKLMEQSTNHTIKNYSDENLPLFKLDGVLIEQAVYNIIHNALVYTPAGSTITIIASHNNEQCNILIADNGQGFPADTQQLIFEKFYRLPGSKQGGTGLGLSIAKGFIEAHGGTIQLQDNEGGGAKFIIRLPAETSFITNLKHE